MSISCNFVEVVRSCLKNHGGSIKSILEDENTESLRGFVYPKTFRNVHRDPESKFYVSKNDFRKDIYPEYPALTYLMILVINQLVEIYPLWLQLISQSIMCFWDYNQQSITRAKSSPMVFKLSRLLYQSGKYFFPVEGPVI